MLPFYRSSNPIQEVRNTSLNTFLKDGSMLWTGSGTFRVSTGHSQCVARFVFFRFDVNSGVQTFLGTEEVTKHIHLTGSDEFEAKTTFDLFNAAGDRTSPEEGCRIDETATRFQ